MAVIKKFAETLAQNLTTFQTYLVDTNPNSTYFRVTEFNDTFTGGKNGFLIEGSQHLKETTEIKIQILDVAGNPVYFEPGNGVPEYYEGISKLVAVYVYEDTPIGQAKITILGELKTYVDDNGITEDIPEQWRDVYNLKWEKDFKINKLLSNEDKVRFYRRPEVSINEIVKPIFSNVVTPITQMGFVDGFAQVPAQGEKLTQFTLPTNYLLQINDGGAWTGSVVGTNIEFTDLGFSSVADDVISKTNLTVTTPYSIAGIVQNFSNQRYTASFNYVEGVDNLATALTGSFGKITISDLETFVGDVARVKIYRRSQSDLADYQFIQEIQLESNELLKDLESTIKNEEFYGIFDQFNFKNYWVTSSNNLTTQFNQTFLYNSVRLDGNAATANQFFTSKSIDLTERSEYTLDFNVRLLQNTSAGNYIKFYISGSRTINNITTGVSQEILKITSDNTVLQKSNVTANFQSQQFGNAKLFIEVKGSGWHVADISLRASQESSFSPNEISFVQPIPRTLPKETFEFLFQFYDINNNYIPIIVTETKTFDGGNLNRINKSLELIPSSLYFQFDSGSGNGNPVPPTAIFIDVVKNFLTGSVTFTSRSFDFFNNELSSSQYSTTITPGYNSWQFPGLLSDINTDTPFLTVENFTGSRDPLLEDIVVQFIEYTGECEGVEDSIIITRVVDGKGGVNFELRPFNGQFIRNSDPSGSLEVQAIRIDGVNEIKLKAGLPAGRSAPQIHVQSGSSYITLNAASSSGFIYGLKPGTTGSGELNYNAIFNRDSIDGQLTLFLIPSGSPTPSASVLTVLTLTDLQDGLDAGVVLYDADSFTINPRLQTTFTPTFSSATASFFRRGRFENPISCSIEVYPSMSINTDFVPEYWVNYITHSSNPDISVVAYDEIGNIIPSRGNAATYPLSNPLVQSKQLLVNFVYTEPWTSASVSVDKLFTIVPEGKPGDESIVFEVNPAAVTLAANSRGVVNDFRPTVTDIRLKQGSRYLAFTGSRKPGTFHIAQSSITASNVTGGLVYFDNAYTESLIISASSGFINLSGSITFPLEIQPYYTSSVYTASVVQPYTKVLEGPPPIQILITPTNVTLAADEVGFVTPIGYSPANTTVQVKEGEDFLRFTTQSSAPGTFRINSIETLAGGIRNIRTGSLSSSSLNTATINYNRFDFPFISASALYTIQTFPFALGRGHEFTSSIFTRTQQFTKNVSVPNARSVDFKASTYTINYDRNGIVTEASAEPIILSATAFNTTSSAGNIRLYLYDIANDGSEGGEQIFTGDVGSNPVTFTLPNVNYTDIGPDTKKTFKVKLTDGNPYTSATVNPFRAEAQLTVTGLKAGADAYKLVASNESTSITADLWTTQLTGSGMKITTFNGAQQLTNQHPLPQANLTGSNLDFNNEPIGVLGFSSASIITKSNYITSSNTITGNPASVGNLTGWNAPAINNSGTIVFRVDFEGDSSTTNPLVRPLARQTQFVTQSIAVQFTPPAPYNIYMQNDSSAVVYRVSGELEFNNTGNTIKASRGNIQLNHRPNNFSGGQYDAYGDFGYKEQFVVSILSFSSHLTLPSPFNTPNARLGGNQATASIPPIISWSDPENNLTGEIVYQIDCEYVSGSISRPGTTLFKTQSLSVQFEGAVGPGIVMRGEWSNQTDYIGKVENTNSRRDAVIYNAVPGTTNYYAAISGSGPTTFVNPSTSTFYVGGSPPAGFNLIGAKQPDTQTDYWEFLGVEEFFVAAKIAIFEESYVKNTINVGTVNGTGAYANIVIAGGRTDPYIAIGQNATIGTSGNGGTSLNPGGSVIGYDRPGIFLGIFEQGASGTTGRFSIKNTGGDRFLKWNGSGLEIAGDITVTGGNAATQNGVSGSVASGSSAAQSNAIATAGTNAQTALTVFSGSLGAMAAISAINSGNAVTFIGGGSIVTNMVATNLITSTNFGYPGSGNFSTSGTFIDLAGSTIRTKGFAVDASGNAFFKGDISAATGNFAGNVIVGGFIRSSGALDLLGTSGTSGFYMQQDGQFRFGHTIPSEKPSIYWNNDTLSIKGRIQTDNSLISEIGNWRVIDGNFQDVSSSIILNANAKVISISEGGAQRVIIKEGTISNPAIASVTVNIDPISSTNFTNYSVGPGNYYGNTVGEEFDNTGFFVSAAGVYTITTLDWGFANSLSLDTDPNFNGYLNVEVIGEIWTTPDYTGTQISSVIFANDSVFSPSYSVTMPFYDGYSLSIYFPSSGTYYIHTKTTINGGSIAGILELNNSINPQTQTFTTSFEQTEIGRDGILVVANSDNFVKIQRTTSDPMIDIKTNGTTSGIRITNTNTATAGGISTAKAIEVLDGSISLAGAGNNFIVNGGFIGTENTAAGIRFGTLGGNSVLMGANWPSQTTNVATARLRPGTTKFGIGGRELIFDSSTLRVKTNIEDYPTSAYESIRRIRPVLYTPLNIINSTTYETNGEESYEDMYPMPNAKEYIGKQGGFIAEWLDADPELRRYVAYGVSGSAVTVDSLAYDKIIVPLTKTVQILMDKVEALEAYISSSL